MSVKEQILDNVLAIYETEAGVTWMDDVANGRPTTTWVSPMGGFELTNVSFWVNRGVLQHVEQANIWVPSEDMGLMVERKVDAGDYEDPYLREHFQLPLDSFIASHPHDTRCFRIMIDEYLHAAALKENQKRDEAASVAQRREAIQIVDKRGRQPTAVSTAISGLLQKVKEFSAEHIFVE